MANDKRMMKLVAVKEGGKGRDKKNFWTKIGVAFENSDGSWNLLFDYLPTDTTTTTIQMRQFDRKAEGEGGEEERDAAE
jgi:hypothetical protein